MGVFCTTFYWSKFYVIVKEERSDKNAVSFKKLKHAAGDQVGVEMLGYVRGRRKIVNYMY